MKLLLLAAAAARVAGHGCVVPSLVGASVSGGGCVSGELAGAGAECFWTADDGYACNGTGRRQCDPDGGGHWDAGVTCRPYRCHGGPDAHIDPHADYRSCTGKGYTGQKCNPSCAAGTHKTPPGFFILLCDEHGRYDAWGAKGGYVGRNFCELDGCESGPNAHQDPKADYSPCNERRSGESCTPRCEPGYTANGTLLLRCFSGATEHGGGYDAAGVGCVPNTCSAAAGQWSAAAAACAGRTGDSCQLSCPRGYHSAGPFRMECYANGSFAVPSAACTPNSCSSGPVGEPAGDWAACGRLRTGQTCRPACPEGTAAESFQLLCDEKGRFDAVHRCQPLSCAAGPRAAQPGADLSACDGMHTGDSCTPKCRRGYSSGGLLQLVCTAKGYDASAAVCLPNNCSGGPSHLRGVGSAADWSACSAEQSGAKCTPVCSGGTEAVGDGFVLVCDGGRFAVPEGVGCARLCSGGPSSGADPDADYSRCLDRTSGSKCTPDCGQYHSTVGTLVLSCSSNGTFDASGARCEPHSCRGGPVGHHNAHDWVTCSAARTGGNCAPDCPRGYSATGNVSLLCDSDGTYAVGTVRCEPEPCEAGPNGADSRGSYGACDGLSTGDVCEPKCAPGSHPTRNFTLVCDESGYDASASKCDDNLCRPPLRNYPGFQFTDASCTTRAECLTAGVQCSDGHVPATASEHGIELECPEHGGDFVPDGCSEVPCPPHACPSRASGGCECDAGYRGDLAWNRTSNRWSGNCRSLEEGGSWHWGLWLLLLLVLGLAALAVLWLWRRRRPVSPLALPGGYGTMGLSSPPLVPVPGGRRAPHPSHCPCSLCAMPPGRP